MTDKANDQIMRLKAVVDRLTEHKGSRVAVRSAIFDYPKCELGR